MKIQKILQSCLGLLVLALCLVTKSSAIPIVSGGSSAPTGAITFGSLPSATFGGSGIPNNAVNIVSIGDFTMGLTATQRFGNPALTNNGIDMFNAVAGGDTLNGQPTYGMWNFDFYVANQPSGVTVKLFVDNDKAVGNDVTQSFTLPNLGSTAIQDSENLGFASLNGGIFNPNDSGQYGFALVAYNLFGFEVARDEILVNVSSPSNGGGGSSIPDGGTTALMFAGGLGVLGLIRYKLSLLVA